MAQGKRTDYTDCWLRVFREEAGLTLEQLAKDAGISKVFLNHIERGRKRPSVHTADALAGVLGKETGLTLTAEDVFPQPGSGMKSPREAALYYRELVRAKPSGTEVVSEEEFEHDMARPAKGREAYYQRQDPKTYQSMTLVTDDGRLIREHPPPWFVDEMRAARKKPARRKKR